MKLSRYNIHIDHGDGDQLLFNGKSGAFVKLTKEEASLLGDIQKMFNVEDNEYLQNLKRGGFIISDELNEIDIIKVRFESMRWRSDSLGLTIVPTLKCNLRCPYCYEPRDKFENNLPSTMNEKIQKSLVAFTKDQIEKHEKIKVVGVTWYGGEPLLAFDVISSLSEKLIDLAHEYEIKYIASIITNGTLLNSDMIEKLISQFNVSQFQLTFDGDKPFHDKTRIYPNGKGTFERVFQSLRLLLDYDAKISLRINVSSKNYESIPGLLDKLKSIGAHEKNVSIYFSKLTKYANSCPNLGYLNSITFANIEPNLYQELIETGFKYSIFPSPKFLPCGALSSTSFSVDLEGYLYKCWYDIGLKERSIGHVETGLNHKVYKWLAYIPFEYKKCKDCTLLPVCLGNCPMIAMENNNPECPPMRYNIKELLTLYYQYKKQMEDTR